MCKNCVQDFRIRPIRAKSTCPSSEEFQYLDGVIYGADYAENPGLQAAITQFKYKFNRQLVDYFAELVCRKLKELRMLGWKRAALIPVPLHKKRLNYRGFNQAELIARATANRYGKDTRVLNPLMRVKNTSQQAKLNKKERQLNLTEAFEIAEDLESLSGKVCFIVDDVCTTGATLDNCARVLKENGIKKVYGLVVARAFK
ncbi:ComF family protein [Patescibacteria group bacterium]|nr:ComF family protein [Patescibacteria group bacterium]MBU1685179.1 ComF family protein [Patescibacteria group bacterium]MBU1938315.1 ComF family protein [Patescibacteria group bacterium]